MFGALIKTYYAEKLGFDPENIVSVALMPCSAKKFECNRPEMHDSGYKDVDFGLTTRELGKMFKEAGLHVPSLPKSDFDDPFGSATGSGVIFGATGGVMEAALRTVLEMVTGEKVESIYEHGDIIPLRGFEGVKYAEITVPKVGPVPDIVAHLVPELGLAERRDPQGRRGARHRQRQEGHGRHQGRRQVQRVPLHRVHGLPGRLPGRRRPADPDQRRTSAPRAPGPSTPRTRPTPCASRTRTRPCSRPTREFLTDGPCGHKSHKLLHTDVHGARQAHPAETEHARTPERPGCPLGQPGRPYPSTLEANGQRTASRTNDPPSPTSTRSATAPPSSPSAPRSARSCAPSTRRSPPGPPCAPSSTTSSSNTQALIPCDRMGLAFVDEQSVYVTSYYNRTSYDGLRIDQGYREGLRGSTLTDVMQSGLPRIINDLEAYVKDHPRSRSSKLLIREGVRSSLTCPLSVEGRVVGFIFRSSRTPYTYGPAAHRAADGDHRAPQPGRREGLAHRAARGGQLRLHADARLRQPRAQEPGRLHGHRRPDPQPGLSGRPHARAARQGREHGAQGAVPAQPRARVPRPGAGRGRRAQARDPLARRRHGRRRRGGGRPRAARRRTRTASTS